MTLKKETRVEDKFFFAAADADYYDETIELTVPYYQLVHQTMIEILTAHFKEDGRSPEAVKGIVLDVGAGTGTESISVLNNFTNLHTLAVDICEPMKLLYEQNYKAKFGSKARKRYKFVVADILKLSQKDSEIMKYFQSRKQNGCKAAISGYCIHHFPLKQKREVYQKMFNFLEPGGILINLDLFTYESEMVRSQAHQMDIDFIIREFDNPSPQFKKSGKIPKVKRAELKEKWVKHMNDDNILDSMESQKRILEKIGFVDVECVFKYWQQGVIRAKKPVR